MNVDSQRETQNVTGCVDQRLPGQLQTAVSNLHACSIQLSLVPSVGLEISRLPSVGSGLKACCGNSHHCTFSSD